jgi:trehalose-6-phosphate synthase
VAVPSRADVAAYQRLTSQVNTLVGRINGAYGTLAYQPVHFLYRCVTVGWWWGCAVVVCL